MQLSNRTALSTALPQGGTYVVCRAGKHASNSASRTHHVVVKGIGLRAVDHARHQPLVLQPKVGIQQHPVSKRDARAGCCCYTARCSDTCGTRCCTWLGSRDLALRSAADHPAAGHGTTLHGGKRIMRFSNAWFPSQQEFYNTRFYTCQGVLQCVISKRVVL
jgi:hypothetical protein